jgi:hypothetical protein
MNAKIEANMSGTDRSVNITATAKPASANKSDTPCTKRSRSWKLTDIFWLKVNTYCAKIKDNLKSKLATYTCNLSHIIQFCTLKRIISTASTTHENPYTCAKRQT